MSFYSDASLVMIPSGYKTSKVYCAKPTDGSGDLVFSRSNDTASRIGPDGLIEKVRTNLSAYSEQFDNAYWSKSNITVTANSTANPINGATTADTIARSGGVSSFVSRQIAQTGIVTFSIFAKAGSTNEVRLNIFDGSTDRGATYNLTTGAISSVYGSPLFTLAQDFGSGWYRISIAVNAATYANCQVHIDSLNSVIIFGAQLETGDIATDYIATTSAAVSVGPVANVPRLDYLGSTCPRLLLEPQRTSLVTFSESFDNAAWSKDAVSVSANASTSPDGYVNADSIVENSATGFHFIQQTFTSSAVSTTYSIFAKLGSGTRTLILREGVNTGAFAAFNLSTGVVAAQSGGTATITQYANGYYRCTLTFTAVAGTSSMQIALSNANSFASYAGNGTSSIIVYGAQVEAGAYATSYIPTLGAAVTRGADAASKTGISSLIGQTAGTAFIDFNFDNLTESGGEKVLFHMKDTGVGERYLTLLNNGTLTYIEYNGSIIANISKTSLSIGNHKAAIAYANNDFVLYVDGVLAGTDTSGTPNGYSTFAFQYYSAGSSGTQSVNQALLFKTRLSNADLAALTA